MSAFGFKPPAAQLHRLMTEAVGHHQRGRLPDAERLYREVLSIDARHPDALHLLGLLAHQSGQNEIANQLIAQAIAIRPNDAAFHVNLSQVQRALQQPQNAAQSLRRATQLEPSLAEAW